jgi:hypothetical protein
MSAIVFGSGAAALIAGSRIEGVCLLPFDSTLAPKYSTPACARVAMRRNTVRTGDQGSILALRSMKPTLGV